MVGPALNSVEYTSRPAANAPSARQAWDQFVLQEAKPRKTTRYGNMGSAGVATSGPDEPPKNRKPLEMCRTFVGEWIWLMKFENGDFEELDCQVMAWHAREKAKKKRTQKQAS
jgi:hypothetical protein